MGKSELLREGWKCSFILMPNGASLGPLWAGATMYKVVHAFTQLYRNPDSTLQRKPRTVAAQIDERGTPADYQPLKHRTTEVNRAVRAVTIPVLLAQFPVDSKPNLTLTLGNEFS